MSPHTTTSSKVSTRASGIATAPPRGGSFNASASVAEPELGVYAQIAHLPLCTVLEIMILMSGAEARAGGAL